MHLFRILLLAIVFMQGVALSCLAQQQTNPTQDDRAGQPGQQQYEQMTPEERARLQKETEEAMAASCAVCGGGLATMLIVIVVLFILNIALLVWVARDAKSRGMDSSILWMFLVMFTSVIGLIIYLFSRPQGPLVACPSCGGKRLAVSATCPHCRNA